MVLAPGLWFENFNRWPPADCASISALADLLGRNAGTWCTSGMESALRTSLRLICFLPYTEGQLFNALIRTQVLYRPPLSTYCHLSTQLACCRNSIPCHRTIKIDGGPIVWGL